MALPRIDLPLEDVDFVQVDRRVGYVSAIKAPPRIDDPSMTGTTCWDRPAVQLVAALRRRLDCHQDWVAMLGSMPGWT